MHNNAETIAAQPQTLRRAIAFIDDNAHLDIRLTDIAAAIGVTPRTDGGTEDRHDAADQRPHARPGEAAQPHLPEPGVAANFPDDCNYSRAITICDESKSMI